MKKVLIGCLLIISCSYAKTQTLGDTIKTNKEKGVPMPIEFEDSEPPFGLTKIKKLIQENKAPPFGNRQMEEKTYKLLSLKEQFTYHMIHLERYRQICSEALLPRFNENVISAQLPIIYPEFTWGERQWKFFSTNGDSVIIWMSECITKTNRVGLNFKRIIVYLNAKQMIPLIVNTYNNGNKDQGLLTVLMLLMKDGKYPPFLATPLFQKLYADENASYKSNTEFNSENEKLIIDLANKYYHAFAN